MQKAQVSQILPESERLPQDISYLGVSILLLFLIKLCPLPFCSHIQEKFYPRSKQAFWIYFLCEQNGVSGAWPASL